MSLIEISSINSLSRGVYSKKNFKKGELINHSDVYFAMPIKEGQLTSGEFKKGIICNDSINKDAPINNIQIVKLAKIISKKLNIPYKINELADDDERSYRVNFGKLKKKSPKLVKNFKSITKIVDEVSEFIKSKKFKFKNSYLRLKYLKKIYKKKNRNLI